MEKPFDPTIPLLLPHETMYKIQIGSKLFEISGASLSSDGPSYFTECFSLKHQQRQRNEENSQYENDYGGSKSPSATLGSSTSNKVLFIDRSADIFELIYRHLQGYFVDIKDEVQFTMLYSDAMYYNLPRLRCMLKEYEYYFANISGKTFKIAKSLFSRNGDSPNYFSMTSGAMYADTENLFLTKKLIRPPPQSAPYISRSAPFFSDILQLLGGAELHMDDKKRESLIKECRYYRFLNLEQRLINCHITYNPLTNREDISLSLHDINRKKLAFPVDRQAKCSTVSSTNENSRESTVCRIEENDCGGANDSDTNSNSEPSLKKIKIEPKDSSRKEHIWRICTYKRPYLDEFARDLAFQINSMEVTLILNKKNKTIHVALMNQTAHQFESVFSPALQQLSISLAKLKITLPPSDDSQKRISYLVLPACISICDLTVNGANCPNLGSIVSDGSGKEQVIDFTNIPNISYCSGKKLHLSKSLWRLGANNGQVMMIALKARAFSGTKEYAKLMDFL
ncbi:hypothetical protein HG535_0G04070 [Zygotorulaspora mrakii]|uniref:BTB domain-containing protein n=1 Tax=Zygotorulaspora mrakii TaxID=42260 RepID=A0A7H9B8F0_ZYGMR|nr:uncharacterized protein HG535_0G04070 [Zygotorulaspora mrakii]QLG74524.1 hypothetical protein HG535_0G04070 [Zygotorulaspora mrakii]